MYETILGIVLGCITICAGVGTIVIAAGRRRPQGDNTGIGGNQQTAGLTNKSARGDRQREDLTNKSARGDSQRAEELIAQAKDILNK